MGTVKWQPIASCPKLPETPYLLRAPGRSPVIAEWMRDPIGTEESWGQWLDGDFYKMYLYFEPAEWLDIS